MLKTFAALLAFIPSLALAGVTRAAAREEALLLSRHVATAVAAATYNGIALAHPFQVTRVTVFHTGNSGGGAGSTTFRLADGTNTCDCAILCTATASGANGTSAAKSIPCTGSCSFPGGALVNLSVSATTCTTTQPSVASIDVRGYRQ
jgi:hypothetical protein